MAHSLEAGHNSRVTGDLPEVLWSLGDQSKRRGLSRAAICRGPLVLVASQAGMHLDTQR